MERNLKEKQENVLSRASSWTIGPHGCAKNPTERDDGVPKGWSGAPKIHAVFRQVNKLKKRQKEGGWSLINRRSHAFRLCVLHMRANVFPQATFSLVTVISWPIAKRLGV